MIPQKVIYRTPQLRVSGWNLYLRDRNYAYAKAAHGYNRAPSSFTTSSLQISNNPLKG